MKRLLIVIVILFHITLACAGGQGTRGGIILNYPMSAQAIGMGEAFTAVADDVNAIFWNPAGLSLLKQRELICYYSNGAADTKYLSVGYAQTITSGVIGCGISTLDGGKAAIYYPDGANRMVKAQSDFILMLSYAAGEIAKNLSIGSNLKIVHSELAETSKATAFACDIGGLYRFSNNLNIGGVIQNIGTKMKYEEEGDALPLNIKLGAACRINDHCLIALDIIKPIENELKVNVGLEYWIIPKIAALRTGYKFYEKGNKSNSDIPLGAGLKMGSYQLDYAYVPHQDLSNTHQISLLVKLGGVRH